MAPFRDTKRLSEDDKAALMEGTLQKVYNVAGVRQSILIGEKPDVI